MSLSKQEVLENLDEVKKYVDEIENVKEKDEKKFEIKNRFTGDVIYQSLKTTYIDVVEEAVAEGANLRDADLEDADLRDANLRDADFYHTKFFGKGGQTKINKDQLDDFLIALGVVVD